MSDKAAPAVRHVVIGCGGFVGRHLVAALRAAGKPVLAFGRTAAGPDAVAGDIRIAADLDRLGLRPDDIVHHLAARHYADGAPRTGQDAWFDAINVEGTRLLLAAMRRAGTTRLVFFSTDMTYGLPRTRPVGADHPLEPLGPYGRSKVRAESLIRTAADEGLRATILRPRFITGPGRLGTLAILFGLIRRGLPVPMFGGGTNRYQMISVDDCVRAALAAAEAGCPPGPFNLGSSHPRTVRDILTAVIRHAGSRSFLIPTPAPLVKTALATLHWAGRTVLYPEQYLGADADFYFDTEPTEASLRWVAQDDDLDTMRRAYDAFVRDGR